MRMPVVSIILLFIVTIAVDFYITLDIKSCTRKRWPYLTYLITSIAFLAYLIVIISLPIRDSGKSLQPIMWMLFSYLSVYLAKIGYIFSSLLGRLVNKIFRINPSIHIFKIFGVLLGLSLCGTLWAGVWYTRHHIIIADEILESPKVPISFDGFKIAQISDMHVGTWGDNTKFVSALVDSVNSLDPDIIVFTGDLVNRQSSELTPFVDSLSKLKARFGIYSILGNHDYGDYVDWNSPEEREINNLQLIEMEKDMGWRLLNNDRIEIKIDNDSIILIGVENWGEPPFPAYGSLEDALPSNQDSLVNQNDNNFKILLSHNPEHWNRKVSKETNIDLTLSGHTHAMQTMLQVGDWRWSPAKYRYDQWGGKYERKNMRGENTVLYVNTGSGSVGMPARLLNAYPEITLITLSRKE